MTFRYRTTGTTFIYNTYIAIDFEAEHIPVDKLLVCTFPSGDIYTIFAAETEMRRGNGSEKSNRRNDIRTLAMDMWTATLWKGIHHEPKVPTRESNHKP